jgi:hypothetical protein
MPNVIVHSVVAPHKELKQPWHLELGQPVGKCGQLNLVEFFIRVLYYKTFRVINYSQNFTILGNSEC